MGYLITVIEDEGCGINPEKIAHLCTMFNDPKQNDFKTDGIGLGLTTARVLNQMLIGGLHVNS